MTERSTENVATAKVHIRWAIQRDMPAVLTIDAAGYRTPWTEEEFLALLRRRNTIGMVAEIGDVIIGFMVYELKKSEILVSRFAVHPDFRRCLVGTAMSRKLADKLNPQRRNRVVTAVSEVDISSQLFLRAAGWRACRVERDGFAEDIDAYLFELRTPASIATCPISGAKTF